MSPRKHHGLFAGNYTRNLLMVLGTGWKSPLCSPGTGIMTLIIIHTAKRPRFKSGLVVVFKYYFNCFATPLPPLPNLSISKKKTGMEELEQSGEEAKAHWVIKNKKNKPSSSSHRFLHHF